MRVRDFYKRPLALLILCLVLQPAAMAATPSVVVSIKPLELLVRAVATDDTTVTTLIPPGANPHNYSMKPSERRALGQADAVFWIGPQMETFLTRLLNGSEFASRSHALGSDKAEHAKDSDHHSDEHHHDHHGHEGESDPHIWLDPEMARSMVRQINQVLASLPEADTAALAANLDAFEQALTATEAETEKRLEPARDLSLFTYHNAFSHFAEHYSLNLVGVLTINPDLSPGARHIAEVQKQLKNAHNPCLMTEKPFSPQSWEPIVGDIDVKFSAWDPLASDITPDRESYLLFQQSLADAVLNCR